MEGFNIRVDDRRYQLGHQMLVEDLIANEVSTQFGDRFSEALKQHDFLSVVWRECLNRDFMLWMLRLSPYRRSYYAELSELVRSLDDERTAAGLEPLNEVVAYQKSALEENYAEERDRAEIVAWRLWELVWDLADFWTRDACVRAIGDAIYDGRYPDSESERAAYRISVHTSLMHEQAKRLRELIDNPFLPNTTPSRGSLARQASENVKHTMN